MSLLMFVLVLEITDVLGQFSILGKSNHLGITTNYTNSTDKICFMKIGCFDLGEPWSRQGKIPQPNEPNMDTTILYFYSRRNTERPYLFRTYPDINIRDISFDGRRPTAVIIHGYRQNATMEWVQTMKYFYLLDRNSNVLVADYSRTSNESLVQSISNARVIGKLSARLLKFLIDHRNLRPEVIHLIGHGLGAQIASYIAKEIQGISRLTALDPLKPFFEGHDKMIRLDKTDAAFVEVIHTNAVLYETSPGYGMIQPHGHVDFYFNDGGNQPGCSFPPGFPKITRLRDVITLPEQYREMKRICNQNKAYDYLIEAYNSFAECVFWGHKVTVPPVARTPGITNWKNFLSFFQFNSQEISEPLPCTKEDCILFGYETINSPLRGIFVIKTSRERPYCIPETGPE